MKSFHLTVIAVVMLLAPSVQGQPNIVVELQGAPLGAGATVDLGRLLVFGVSDPVQQFGEDGTTVTIPGLPAGTYQVERTVDEFSGWSQFRPGVPHAGGDFVFEDESLNFSISFYYRARSDGVTRSFTVRNTGASALGNIAIGIAPEDAQIFDFEVSGFGFPTSLASGESASFEVVFMPFELGARAVTLQIFSDDPDQGTFALELMGEGLEQGGVGKPLIPVLGNVVLIPATAELPARMSATLSGGAAGAMIGIEASTDLGFADPWVEIGAVTLDSNGSATISNLPDPGSVGVGRNFFRLAVP